jgi:hypothetical protein
MRINYEKHFAEDPEFNPKYEVPYKTMRYIRKLAMRQEIASLSATEFLTDPSYADQQIWDLKYISTSDEEDNDSSESSQSEDEDEEKKESKPEEKSAHTLEEVKIQIDQSQAAVEKAS